MHVRDMANAFRYRAPGKGHYESYFQRANHPTSPLAFWIRYTVFSPRHRPEETVGELWAVFFDGQSRQISAAKQVFPWAACRFAPQTMNAQIGDATLDARSLSGSAAGPRHRISWQLDYSSPKEPLFLLPARMYEAGFPKAKALVGSPLARFSGQLTVDGRAVAIEDWVGSQNHNWGEKHTDRYAWGQVAGFDDAPEVFLECATASVRVGPLYTPPMSPVVLRLGDEELRFSSLGTAVRARAHYAPFSWQIRTQNELGTLEVEFEAQASDFVALPYDNPPGGQKICLNSKLAACRVRLERRRHAPLRFTTARRAAFEILGDQRVPSVTEL